MLATVIAQPAQQTGGGFGFFELLLPLALAFLIFTMFRKQRKMKKQVAEQRTQMVPGTEVMTNFGLFGTMVSLDEDNNKALIEIAPGVTATVHSQTLSKVVVPESDEVEQPADEVSDGAPADTVSAGTVSAGTVPDDASSLTGPRADADEPVVNETPEETIERLNRENARNRNDKDQ